MLAIGIPTGDAFLEFGRAVEMDFLSALNNPVFEDTIATGHGVPLRGGLIRTAGLKGGGNDAGIAAEPVGGT